MRVLVVIVLLLALCAPAMAQNECAALTPAAWTLYRASDTAGIVHDIFCVNYSNAKATLPYYQGNFFTGGAITSPVTAADGTIAAPSYSWTGDPDTGFYWTQDGRTRFSSNGTASLLLGSGTMTVLSDTGCYNAGTSSDASLCRVNPGYFTVGTAALKLGARATCDGIGAGIGVLCYDTTLNKFRYSQNNGALADAFVVSTPYPVLQAWCNGIATSSSTIHPSPFHNNGGGAAANACTNTVLGNGIPVPAGTWKNLFVSSIDPGVTAASGVVTVYKNDIATTVTCTMGTGISCSNTASSFTTVAGDTLSIRFTTQALETLSHMRFSLSYQP